MLIPTAVTRLWARSLFSTLAAFALGVAVVLSAVRFWPGAVVAAGIALVCAILAIRSEKAFGAYTAYCRVAGSYARLMRALEQAACFAVVTAAGRAGTTFLDTPPGSESMWSPKHSLERDMYRAPYVSADLPKAGSWVRRYVAWTRHSDNLWAITLLPFLLVLRTAQETSDHEIRGEIYALY